MSKKSGNEIQDAQNELEQAQHRYLRSHGWQYTSSTPGCLWMWVKRCELTVDPKHGAVTHDDGKPSEPRFDCIEVPPDKRGAGPVLRIAPMARRAG